MDDDDGKNGDDSDNDDKDNDRDVEELISWRHFQYW